MFARSTNLLRRVPQFQGVRGVVVMSAENQIHRDIPHQMSKLMRNEVSDLDKKAASSGFEFPWLIRTAAVIERLPVVSPPVSDIEMTYKALQAVLHKSRTKQYPKEWTQNDQTGMDEDDAPKTTAPSKLKAKEVVLG
eukprot:c11188_g2_i2.p2 GENE.c11188_g2_i2~~c11188_g2_i2.p2  ORF type:complete len:137 (-),score=30.89 c11188_g2_i2:559-969(-)